MKEFTDLMKEKIRELGEGYDPEICRDRDVDDQLDVLNGILSIYLELQKKNRLEIVETIAVVLGGRYVKKQKSGKPYFDNMTPDINDLAIEIKNRIIEEGLI